MQKGFRKRYLLLLLIPLIITLMPWMIHFVDARALKQYQAQLRTQGEKLTLTELGAPRSSAELASTRAIWRFGQKWKPAGLYVMAYDAAGVAHPAWRESEAAADPTNVNWSVLETNLAEAQEDVASLRQALQQTDADLGPVELDVLARQDDYYAKRAVTQWLREAVVTELHRGRHQDALGYLKMLVRLTHAQRQSWSVVGQMIRTAIGDVGLETTWELLQADGWDDADLLSLQSEWEQVDLLKPVELAMLGERARFSGIIQSITNGTGRVTIPQLPMALFWSLETDHRMFLERSQVALGNIRDLTRDRNWMGVQNRFAEETTGLDRLKQSSRYPYYLTALAMLDFNKPAQVGVRNETFRQMTLAAIALKRFELRHHELPKSLDELTPGLLAQPPRDLCDGKPLRYRAGGDGTFLLYSVGMDGRDDGGSPALTSTNTVFTLWNGRDAVWPQPVRTDKK